VRRRRGGGGGGVRARGAAVTALLEMTRQHIRGRGHESARSGCAKGTEEWVERDVRRDETNAALGQLALADFYIQLVYGRSNEGISPVMHSGSVEISWHYAKSKPPRTGTRLGV
jgi:hypothetical protein